MADTNSRVSTLQLIGIPAVITLAITILRLVGELQHWSPTFFNPAAGGGGAIVGISWLPIPFGIYFAMKLAGAGRGPWSIPAAIGYNILALVVGILGIAVGFSGKVVFPGNMLVGLILMVVALFIPIRGWRELFKVLIAYAYAARIPVVSIMFFAMQANDGKGWGTHYDVAPPNFPSDVGLWTKYFEIGVVPQMLMWIAYTIIIGSLFGTIAVAVLRNKATSKTTTATA